MGNDNESKADKKLKMYKLFFTRYTFAGLIFILVGIIIEKYNVNNTFIVSVIQDVILTIGTAVLVGAVFDFSQNSESFTIFVSNILKKIVVSKEFLGEMSEKDKRNSLELILKPTDKQIEECSSIGTFYKKSIDNFMDLYNRQFKTNLSINIVASVENGLVVCKGNVSHRRYKINGEYQPIETVFEREADKILNNYILLPNSERIDLKENDDVEVEASKSRKYGKKYITKIPERCNEYPYITLYKEIIEIGYDHWILFNWSSLTPCDGISFELHCTDDLIVKEHKIFDNPKLYEVMLNENKNKMSIISSTWLNEYTGFAIMISKK